MYVISIDELYALQDYLRQLQFATKALDYVDKSQYKTILQTIAKTSGELKEYIDDIVA